MNKLETIAAEMRLAAGAKRLGDRTYVEYRDVLSWADRIEAAAKPPSNAAAMREALKLCMKYMCVYCKSTPEAQGRPCLNGCETLKIAMEALSAPPRNCDRYANWKEAWDAFAASYFGPTDPGEMEYSFGVWLFAKAEGGAE